MFKPTDCILVLGRRGCGKSHLAKRLQRMWTRRVIVDVVNEYSTKDGEVVRSFEEFSKKLIQFKKEKRKEFVLIYQFPVESHEFEAEFNEIMRLCFYFKNIQVVIEEVQNHCKTQWLPIWLRKNLLLGRHQNLSLLFTSQRPGEVNKTIFSQCSHVFCGNLIDGNDIKYVSNFLNQKSERLVNLPERRFLYFSNGKITEISNDI